MFPSDEVTFAQPASSVGASGIEHPCVATGTLYASTTGPASGPDLPGAVSELYRREGPAFVSTMNAQLACAIFDSSARTLFVARDHLGIEALYYGENADKIIVSSHAPTIAALLDTESRIDHTALARFLCFNYNPGRDTIWHGIHKFPPGHHAVIAGGTMRMTRYWRPSYAQGLQQSEESIIGMLREGIDKAIDIRAHMTQKPPAVFVSGGLDSSTVLGVLSKHRQEAIHTYSYRCRGQGFDESHYARAMAKSVDSIHTEIEYTPENVSMMTDLVKGMSEPFCDVGINIATALLGRAACNDAQVVLTGDGGDELFGGHPIYEADKVAAYTDLLPPALTRAITRLLAWLPDSDKKKTLAVKLKRFGESLRFPRELGTQRWRLYYLPEDLPNLMTSEVAAEVDSVKLFEYLLTLYSEADAEDALGRTLYADYFSVVDFYLRRNDLNRSLGIQTRFPFFDKDLVDLCAKVPSALKIKGWFDTKYIMKRAIEPWLPAEIVFRKDKLGHSIPLKNWMRDNSHVREFVGDTIATDRLKRRGLIDPKYVKRLWDDHMASKMNNSHRLWTLCVLELWLDEHVGRAS
jgi:asparagine synthase (glutamine-hydrolysing)